jgi:hypothetical protein
MTDFQTNPEIDDELLSAYLDDELSPDERAHVDARLAADPAARRLLDQLRATSEAVHKLPHESIGEDLRGSILRRAEAAMLESNGGRTPTVAASDESKDEVVSLRDSLPRITIGQTRRGWVWAGLAIAAGLLIMVLQPGDQKSNDSPQIAASSRADKADRVADGDRGAVPEMRAWRAAEPASPPLAAKEPAPPEPVAEPATSAPGATAGASPPAPHTVTLESAVRQPAASDATSTSSSDESRMLANGGVAPARAPAAVDRFGREGEGRDRVGGAAAAPKLAALADDSKGVANSSGNLPTGATNGPAQEPMSAARRELAEAPAESTAGGELQLGMIASDEPAPPDGLAVTPSQKPEVDFLVVHVVVKPEALRNKAFDQLLAKNGVEWEEPLSRETAAASLEEKLAQNVTLDRSISRRRSLTVEENARQTAEEAVLVEAPRKTIELCLSALKQDQDSYLGVSVDAPGTEAAKDKVSDESLVEAEETTKRLADDLGSRFNRGIVPPQSAEQSNERYSYDFYAQSGQKTGARGGFGGGEDFGGIKRVSQKAEPPKKERSSGRDESSPSDSLDGRQSRRGRARRLNTWAYGEQINRGEESIARGGAAGRRLPSTSTLSLEATRQQAQAPTDAEQLNVLFVLRPANETPAKTAPSPATENRQQ